MAAFLERGSFKMIAYLLMIDSEEDRSKFEKLYIAYRDFMYYVANQILNNPQDAEDAVHQAFVKIAENIEIVDGKICPRTKSLFATITENAAIDMYRRKQRRQTVPLDFCAGITIEYDGENTLTFCMTKLPTKYRNVLLLKHYHGYTSKETAKIMGITEINVIKIHQRAKKKLEMLCKEEGLI